MQKNFSIDAMGAEVILGDRRIDIHNRYRTVSVGTDTDGDAITLVFERNGQFQGPNGSPETVTLRGSGGLKVAFNNLADQPVPLDGVEIAYFDAECPWGHFLDEDLAVSQGFEGLHVSFSGGLELRIRCAFAELTTA